MCFRISNTHPSAKIAAKDIKCYKVLWSDYSNLYKYALAKEIFYKPNVEMPAVELVVLTERKEILDGYYSYRTIDKLKAARRDYGERHLDGAINVACIIPKGTKYFENETQYVSETIIMVE